MSHLANRLHIALNAQQHTGFRARRMFTADHIS